MPEFPKCFAFASLNRMATSVLIACGLGAAGLANAQSDGSATPYFWPGQHKTVTYKMKSHAMRGTLTLNAGREVTIDGRTYRELTASARRVRAPHQKVYLRADEQGLYERFSDSPTAPETLMLKLPAKAGDTWQTVGDDGKPSERKIAKIAPCEVRGRTFDQCVTVAYEAAGFPAIAVFAPEYGEVVNSQVNGFVMRELTTK